ncbi:small secreted domain DUF320 [Actinomadura pelletieri DSM 43383]|uniref:Small secreted domain DUF320 n=1 Tax=Actinomadura pelletieri DSM 43383 TaxID=1120940 RepID=A0A495R0H3_9ACTN|nr:chaplin family protein [Actinomadura pelletieri]RKS79837.1 small secreted domain DUF320 [Actinomadura pelletieri DSM 43383]
MRLWTRNTGRIALMAVGALAAGSAFGPGAVAATKTGGIGAPGAAIAEPAGGARADNARHGDGGDMKTSGNFSIGGGNQVRVPISIPVNVCGNAIAIAGISKAKCKGGASVSSHRRAGHGGERSAYRVASGGGGGDMKTSGMFSILGGNQIHSPISVPVNVCGNAVAVLGIAAAKCKGGASVKRLASGDPNMETSGMFSVLGGNQINAPISVPVDVCGNAVAVLGMAEAKCKGGASVKSEQPKLPPTLRTPPKKKPYKPSKHRPGAGHTKLPSTMRSQQNSRLARPAAIGAAPDYRKADGLPVVRTFLESLNRTARVRGVDIKPTKVGKVGTQVLR